MVNGDAPPAGESSAAYSFRPSLLGAAREFRLTDDALEWTAGASSGRIPFNTVRRVRMSYRPASMQSQRYVTEIWAEGAPKLEIVSSSWKSMIEQERFDRPYSAFVRELNRRLAATGGAIRFDRGSNAVLYWPGLAVFAAVGAALALMFARALLEGAWAGAAFVAAFFALLLWQSGNFFRRNRPGTYHPDAPPAVLLPGS